MHEQDVRLILLKASAAYPNQIELTQETLAVWIERLESFPFEKAIENLNTHIDSNRFFPSISDIRRYDPNVYVDHEQQKLETRERLENLKRLESVPAVSDERLAEIKREVDSGKYDYLHNNGSSLLPIGVKFIGD